MLCYTVYMIRKETNPERKTMNNLNGAFTAEMYAYDPDTKRYSRLVERKTYPSYEAAHLRAEACNWAMADCVSKDAEHGSILKSPSSGRGRWAKRVFSTTDYPTHNPTESLVGFLPGKTYYTRSIGDNDCLISVTVEKRTRCFITCTDGKRYGVKVRDGVEYIMPWGRCSMAPSICADREAVTVTN